jgi:hypothetical protein
MTQNRLAAPSMGTWLDLCLGISGLPGAGTEFIRLTSCLVPDRTDENPCKT